MKAKINDWIRRYLPAEILSVTTTFMAAGLTFGFSENYVAAALAGTWGGNAGFFGYILTLDIFRSIRECRLKKIPYTDKNFWINIRGLLVEFGITEIADSFFIRAFLMYYLPILIDNFSIGILVAKVAADVTFYIPAIFFYEINKKHHKKDL